MHVFGILLHVDEGKKLFWKKKNATNVGENILYVYIIVCCAENIYLKKGRRISTKCKQASYVVSVVAILAERALYLLNGLAGRKE